MKKILITGVAGFIGHAVAKNAIAEGYSVVGIDNLSGDKEIRELKDYRLKQLTTTPNFEFIKADILTAPLENLITGKEFVSVIHLAALAGVRKSMKEPTQYINNNIVGFVNILDFARTYNIRKVIYASSSSVYGDNINTEGNGLKEDDNTENPKSVYAVTKKTDELLAYVYSQSYNITTIGLRLFSVYGPCGRPDMAPCLFAKSIISDKQAILYNNGRMKRDFTYIDDVAQIIVNLINEPCKKKSDILNIGASEPHSIIELYNIISKHLKKNGRYTFEEAPIGDVHYTCANNKKLKSMFPDFHFTSLDDGLFYFCQWFRIYCEYKS